MNETAARLVGWELEELINKHQHDVIHHTKPDGTAYDVKTCPIYAAFKDGKIHHVDDEIFWRKDGSFFPVEYVSTPIKDDNGNLLGAVVIFKDITRRKKAEEALKKANTDLQKINHAYGRFVPHEFLRTLGRESIVEVGLGDQIQGEMTILFSDIRSYSTLSESMSPKQTFNFLNAYLSRVGPIIKENNGFVNHFYGDGIMAVYQSEGEDAVIASIEMQKEVAEYNAHRKNKGRKPIKIGIGIHTGLLMLGIIGDQQRMDTAAVADSVNIAARMEGLTKFYGASIVVSQHTLSTIEKPEHYNHRFLGKVQVKGREGAMSVFEIFDGDSDKMIELKMKTKVDFEEGLESYFAKEFEVSAPLFKQVLNNNPEDKAAKLYLEHSAEFMVRGVPDAWQGVEVMESKF